MRQKKPTELSDIECARLMVHHTFKSARATNQLDSWIMDLGATYHMCNDDKLFVELCSLNQPLEGTLGDEYALKAPGVESLLEMKLHNGKTKNANCMTYMLHVPKLSYNLLSVSKATEAGKTTKFREDGCHILDANQKLIAAATREGSLYNFSKGYHQANTTL